MLRYIFLVVLSFFLPQVCGGESSGPFPFIGKVKADKVNIRAGSNTNYEVITRVKAGQRLVVVREMHDWYEVELPEGCIGWMAKGYLEKHEDGFWEVTGDRVRVRTKPALHWTVLTHMGRGEKVEVMEEKEDWCRILLPPRCHGWVRSDLVAYHSTPAQYALERKVEIRKEALEKAESLFQERFEDDSPRVNWKQVRSAFRQVMKKYPGTSEAAGAEEGIARISREEKAERHLLKAESLYRQWMKETSPRKIKGLVRAYRRLFRKFPGTRAARLARKRVEELEGLLK